MVSRKITIVFIVFYLMSSLLFSQSIPNQFFKNNSVKELSDLFNLNVSIMRFRNRGNINDINPVDSDNLVKIIRSTVDSISTAGMDEKDSLVKTITYLSEKDKSKKILYDSLKEKVQNTPVTHLKKYEKDILTFMSSIKVLSEIRNKWYENYKKPVFSIKTTDIIDYSIIDYKTICEKQTPQYDILITGDIEKVQDKYLISIIFYSLHRNKIIHKTAFMTTIDKISENIEKQFKEIAKQIFYINYAELKITTGENTEIYINSNYMAKQNLSVRYVKPDSYLITLHETNAKPYNEVIEVYDNENKMIDLTPDFFKQKQPYLFNIEPHGTKVFINSQYAGTTPFRKELPQGNFIISAKKSDLYEDFRYSLNVNEIVEEEQAIQYHLMTRDLSKTLKMKQNLYYTAFWSFTFSLAITVPTTIIAVQFYKIPNTFGNNASSFRNPTEKDPVTGEIINKPKDSEISATDQRQAELKLTADILQFTSIGLAINTVFNLGWLFYSLFDYLNTLEKKDFIPILNFYSSPEESGVIIGGVISIPTK